MDRRAALIAGLDAAVAYDADNAPLFVWGERDCLLRCADIVRDAIGIDPAEPYRGRYDTPEGAAEVIGPKGLLWTSRQRARALGAVRIRVAEAQPGDWGVMKGPVSASVLKYRGDFWFGCDDRGFSLIPSSMIAAAWSFCE